MGSTENAQLTRYHGDLDSASFGRLADQKERRGSRVRGKALKLGTTLKADLNSGGAHLACVVHAGDVAQRRCLDLVNGCQVLLCTMHHCCLPNGLSS